MEKLNQLGMLSLHVIVPAVIAIAAVAGIGTYVLQKSGAAKQPISDDSRAYSCGNKKRNGQVYASAVGTNAKFKAAKDSDSVRNLAYALCKKGQLSAAAARAINDPSKKAGNWTQKLQDSLDIYRRDTLRLTGSNSQGSPGKISVTSLGLTPVGF